MQTWIDFWQLIHVSFALHAEINPVLIFFSLLWTWSQEILFPSTLCRHDGSDAKNLKEVFQLQFGAGEGAGLEENLAAAQQQMQVMQQVVMMEMVMLLVLSIVLLAVVVMERGIFYENSLRAASAELLWKVATQ